LSKHSPAGLRAALWNLMTIFAIHSLLPGKYRVNIVKYVAELVGWGPQPS
jgi:hypothetical protein